MKRISMVSIPLFLCLSLAVWLRARAATLVADDAKRAAFALATLQTKDVRPADPFGASNSALPATVPGDDIDKPTPPASQDVGISTRRTEKSRGAVDVLRNYDTDKDGLLNPEEFQQMPSFFRDIARQESADLSRAWKIEDLATVIEHAVAASTEGRSGTTGLSGGGKASRISIPGPAEMGSSLPKANPQESTLTFQYGLRHPAAPDLVATLKELFPGLQQITVDAGGRVVQMRVPQRQLDAVKKAFEILDKPSPAVEQEIKIFVLQHSDAEDLAALLKQLYPDAVHSIVSDIRTNSLIVRGPKGDGKFLQEIEAILMRLDAADVPPSSGKSDAKTKAPAWVKDWPVPRATAKTSGRASGGNKKAGEVSTIQLRRADANKLAAKLRSLFPSDAQHIVPDAVANSISVSTDAANYAEICNVIAGEELPPAIGHLGIWQQMVEGGRDDLSVETLRSTYRNYNAQAVDLAREHQRLSADKNATSPAGDAAAIRQKLAGVVELAFTARQQLQQAELSALSQGLIRVQRQIAVRDKIKQQIIDRRVNDLLNPQTGWEGQDVVPSGVLPQTSAAMPPTLQTFPEGANSRPASARVTVSAPNVAANVELSQATELAKRFDDLRRQVTRTEAAIKQFPSEATGNLQAELASARRDLDLLRKEHAARMELLQLELSHAENELQSRKADADRGRQLYERGAIAITEYEQLRRASDAAKLRLDRAKAIFSLFRNIDASVPETAPKTSGASHTDSLQEPVGEVKEIDAAAAKLTISCLEENDVRPRELLEIRRSEGKDHSAPFRLIARIEVVEVDKRTATARIVEAETRRVGDQVETEHPKPGDSVARQTTR